MADSFVNAIIGVSEDIKAPVWPTLLLCIKMMNQEINIDQFAATMQTNYGISMTSANKAKIQAYVNGVAQKVLADTTTLAAVHGPEMGLKIAKAIWFTKVFPAILGLEFKLETESTLDSQFL
jgi:hypothetical protein